MVEENQLIPGVASLQRQDFQNWVTADVVNFWPAIILTQDAFLLHMCIPSMTFLLNVFLSPARIFVSSNENSCNVVVK